MDNQIDPTTGTVRLKAMFPNETGALFPNQFVNARLLVDTLKNAVLVPAAAIQRSPQSTFVCVVKPDSTVEMRDVEVALTEGDDVRDPEGLAAGESVVVDGVDKLQPGTKVTASSGHAGAPHAATAAAGSAAPAIRLRTAPAGSRRARETMSPSRPFILRPIATSLLMAGLLIAGVDRLPAAARLRAAAGRLPDDPGRHVLSGREPDVMASAVTAPLERQFGQLPGLNQMTSTSSRGQLGHHAAVRPRPQHRRRRAGGPGGDQRRGHVPAARPPEPADLQQDEPGRRADPHARADLEDAAALEGRGLRGHALRPEDLAAARRRPRVASAADRSRPCASRSTRPRSPPTA